MHGLVEAICISMVKRDPMREVDQVMAIAGRGLEGDRYALAEGSYNSGRPGHRQVTLINGRFVTMSSFRPVETRRNLTVSGIELMEMMGKDFQVGDAVLRGVKYCDPCVVPNAVTGKSAPLFKDEFFDCGGL